MVFAHPSICSATATLAFCSKKYASAQALKGQAGKGVEKRPGAWVFLLGRLRISHGAAAARSGERTAENQYANSKRWPLDGVM
jgi:hypothetical protein